MRRDLKRNSTQRALCERKRFTSPAQGPREPLDKSIQPKAPGNPSRNSSSPRPQGTAREIHTAQGPREPRNPYSTRPQGTRREIHPAQGPREPLEKSIQPKDPREPLEKSIQPKASETSREIHPRDISRGICQGALQRVTCIEVHCSRDIARAS